MTTILMNPQAKKKSWAGVIATFLAALALLSVRADAQIQTDVPALKNVYAHDFYIGCLLSYRHVGFPTDSAVTGQSAVVDPNGGYLVKYHMNSMSPGNNMKLQYTVDLTSSAAHYSAASGAAKDSVNVHPVVRFNGDLIAQLNWAKRQEFTFRGHNLVWHSSAPTEFFRSGYTTTGVRLSKDSITIRTDNYIHEVIRLIHQSWPGLLSAMDVVNEAIDDNTNNVRTTGNEWYATFGDSTYVMLAFQLARQYTTLYGETQMKLYYNDYNTDIAAKADGIVRLVTPIFQAGLLDGIGMQEHDASSPSAFPVAANFVASYNKFYPVCSEMAVTELDATTGSASPSASVLATQANQYGMLYKCFVERSYKSGRGKIISVSKDGLNDANTFKTGQSSSLWNANDQCKPSFFAAADVGMNYNALDSLITYGDSLKENNFTPASWSNFSAALASAHTARSQNYSASVSADTGLGSAKSSLQNAVDSLVPSATGVNIADETGPRTFMLSQNYPNPFNPATKISYQLPVISNVTLKIYDMLGREVQTLFAGARPAGSYTATFDGTSLASGVYVYQMRAGTFVDTKKLLLLK